MVLEEELTNDFVLPVRGNRSENARYVQFWKAMINYYFATCVAAAYIRECFVKKKVHEHLNTNKIVVCEMKKRKGRTALSSQSLNFFKTNIQLYIHEVHRSFSS